MINQKITVGPFQCNCHLFVCPKTFEAFIVDPGDESEKIIDLIQGAQKSLNQPIQVKYLFHTHAHLDHIGATKSLKEKLKLDSQTSEIYLHHDDHELYLNLKKQGEIFGMQYEDPEPVDRFFEDEQEIIIGDMKLKLIHTPGHSPGSVCFHIKEGSHEMLLSGDTLFQGSIGRTDLWGGNLDELLKNIKKRLFVLDDDLGVFPGHGPETLIGIEKRENPFFQ